jgi:hypothetical protein
MVEWRNWYEPWRDPRPVLDSPRPTEELVPEALAFVREGMASPGMVTGLGPAGGAPENPPKEAYKSSHER